MVISLQDFEENKMEASYTNFKISGNKLISKKSQEMASQIRSCSELFWRVRGQVLLPSGRK